MDELTFAVTHVGTGLVESPFLRYKVGDKVLCKTGMTEWSPGVIVQLYYVEPGREHQGPFPYQVKLTDGRLIFVPRDMPQLCRKVDPAWWENLFSEKWREDVSRSRDRATLLRRLGEEKCKAGFQDLSQLFQGRIVDQRDVNGNTALLSASREGWVDGVRELLELRADPNLEGPDCRRPLHEAVSAAAGSGDVVRMLLAARSDLHAKDENPEWKPESATGDADRWHRTALHYAAAAGLGSVSRILLEAKADPNAEDGERKRPLHLAIEEESMEVIDMLIGAGADIDAGNLQVGLSSTPLISCAYDNTPEIAQRLIEARANLNASGKEGMTALHIAARSRREQIVRMLLDARADTTVKASSGLTAADLAAKNGHSAIAALIAGSAQQEPPAALVERPAPRSVAEIDAEMRAKLFID